MATIAPIVNEIRKAWKAVYAGIVAFLGGVIAITTGDVTFTEIGTNQWFVIAMAVVVAVGGVWKITNKPA